MWRSFLWAAGMAPVWAALPLVFVPNAGQLDPGVLYWADGAGVRAAFLAGGVVLERDGQRMELRFEGAGGRLAGEGSPAGRANFFLGPQQRWRTDLPVYAAVRYRELYPGVDALYSGPQFKSEFHLAPGADPGRIRMRFPRAQRVWIDSAGNLRVRAGGVEFRESRPAAHQDGEPVSARYRILADGSVGFAVAAYDPGRPLVIDPVITYSTYLGGTGGGAVTAVALDGLGNLYAAGWTESIDFPIAGAYQAVNRGGVDAFVVKLSPTGNSLLYATYIGGNGDDRAAGIAVDAIGQAHVVGSTGSSNFPLQAAARSSFVGGREAFALKLTATGSALVYSTYLGGASWEAAAAVAVDGAGFAYVAGVTQSADFPAQNAVQATIGGMRDAFVVKLDAAGSRVFSTFLGGAQDEHLGGIATDGTGVVYLAGGTFSANFPIAAAIQAANAGGQDAFVVKMKTTAPTELLYSTYLGGAGGSAAAPEQANAIAIDAAGSAYVTGVVSSTNFPVTAGSLQPGPGGGRDVFVTKLNSGGTARLYSTYLGWTGFDWASGIAVDAAGNAYVAGYTSSVSFANIGGVQGGFRGLFDAFISKLNPAGNALTFSTLYGGGGADQANAIAVDSNGNMFVGGQTASFDFPAVAALQTTNLSGNTGWVARLGETPPPTQRPSADSADMTLGANGAVTLVARFSHPAGASALTSVSVLLSRTTSVDFACLVSYASGSNTLTLAANVAASGGTALTPGSGTAQNSQCQLIGAGSGAVLAGNQLTLTLSLVLGSDFPGNNTVYLLAADANGNTGWVAYAGLSQVSADSVSPGAAGGDAQVFTFVFSDTKAAANLWGAAITINSSLSSVNACSLVYDRAANTIALLYDSALGSSAKPFGSDATIQNSQCALGVATRTTSGTSTILTVPLTFKGPFTGPKNIYMLAVGPNGNTGWVQRGAYFVRAGGVPVAQSVTPSSGSGSTQSFTFVVSDQGGSNFITGAALLFTGPVGFTFHNACYIVYDRAANRLALVADNPANGSASIAVGGSGLVSNSQCAFSGSGSSVSFGETTVTLTVTITFLPAFAGPKNVFLFAAEAGYQSGWVQRGAWNVPGTPPTVGTLTPASGSGYQATFQVSATTAVSPSDLTSLAMQFVPGLDTGGCHVVYNRTAGTIGLFFNGGLELQTKPIGSSATLANAACAVGYSAANTSGGAVTLTVILVFTPQFPGAKQVQVNATNPYGSSGWQVRGSWTVP
jgi:hypothetical protein